LSKSLNVIVATLIFGAAVYQVIVENAVVIKSIDEYKEQLSNEERKRGKLYSEDCSSGNREDFKNCKSFSSLKERGCFGYTTRETGTEMRYAHL